MATRLVTNPRWVERILRREFRGGCAVTFHTTHPGERGNQGHLAGPYPIRAGDLTISGRRVVAARALTLGQAPRNGRAQWVGIHAGDGFFALGLELERARQLTAGAEITLARGALGWSLGGG